MPNAIPWSAVTVLSAACGVSFGLYLLTGGNRPVAARSASPVRITVRSATRPMQQAATAFLSALTPELRRQAVFPFDSEERLNWHFVPKTRQGVRLDALNEPQRKAAVELLRQGLSAAGYRKVETIRSLENVLREMEGDSEGRVRNTGHYYLSLFGTPSANDTWGWRYEGHHLSLNWTVVRGTLIASTPQFLGANPARVNQEGTLKGTRALAAEEDLARTLIKALNPSQRQQAIVSEKAPADILTGAQREAAIQEDRGIAYRELDKAQQTLLVSLISEHARVQTEAVAKARLEKIRKAGLDGVKFAWMGGTEPGEGHYYRIQGPTFLIEYDNTQNDANHIHAVWRDFQGDFGRDLLAEHGLEHRSQAAD